MHLICHGDFFACAMRTHYLKGVSLLLAGKTNGLCPIRESILEGNSVSVRLSSIRLL
jgi:hypothetical protein